MRLLFTSDWHLDAVTAGVPRVREFPAYLDRILAAVDDHDVAAVIMTGDLFDPGTMQVHALTTLLIEAARRLGDIVPTVFIAGNHDVIETSEGWTTLSPLRAAEIPGVYVFEKPGAMSFDVPITLLALPYMAAAADTDPNVWAEAFDDARWQLGVNGSALVVAAHLTVPGAVLGSETAEMRRGRDVDLPLDHLAGLDPALVVNGHYHRAQVVEGRCKVAIPGSPWRITFGEAADADKGFFIADLSDALPR